MEKKDLISAGIDLSTVCKLEPPFNTKEEDFSNESDFVENLKNEIVQFVEFQDSETKRYDFQSGDVVLIQETTKEVIKELSPETVKRLKEVFGVDMTEEKVAPKPKRKTASVVVVQTLCSKFDSTKEEIKEALRLNETKLSDTYIDGWISEFGMIINELKEQGKLQ